MTVDYNALKQTRPKRAPRSYPRVVKPDQRRKLRPGTINLMLLGAMAGNNPRKVGEVIRMALESRRND